METKHYMSSQMHYTYSLIQQSLCSENALKKHSLIKMFQDNLLTVEHIVSIMGTLKSITGEIPESILSIFESGLIKLKVLLKVELLLTSCTSNLLTLTILRKGYLLEILSVVNVVLVIM